MGIELHSAISLRQNRARYHGGKSHKCVTFLKAKPSVQVYDLRSTARVMTTLPFSAGPALLRFHPRYSGTLLIASTSGAFTISQAPATSYAPIVQVSALLHISAGHRQRCMRLPTIAPPSCACTLRRSQFKVHRGIL